MDVILVLVYTSLIIRTLSSVPIFIAYYVPLLRSELILLRISLLFFLIDYNRVIHSDTSVSQVRRVTNIFSQCVVFNFYRENVVNVSFTYRFCVMF